MYDFLKIENLDKNYAELKRIADGGGKVNILSMAENARPHTAAILRRFVLYVARDRLHAAEVAEKLSDYMQKKVLLLPCKDDFLIYKHGADAALSRERLSVLRDLAENDAGALVISPETLAQYLPRPRLFKERAVRLETSADADLYALAGALTLCGYIKTDRISALGEFAVRGDVLDVYPVAGSPVRISFFGDIVESVKVIDAESMMGIRELGSVTIYPACEILYDAAAARLAAERIARLEIPKGADRLRIKSITEGALERLEKPSAYGGFDWIIPFAKESFSTVFDWLPDDATVLYDEPNIIKERLKGYYEEFYERVANLTASGEIYREHKDAAVPEDACFSGAKNTAAIAFLQISSLNPVFFPDAALNMPSIRAASYNSNPEALVSDLKALLKSGKRVVLCCKEKDRARSVYESLSEKSAAVFLADAPPPNFKGVCITPLKIGNGFILEKSGLAVIGANDLFRKQKTVKKTERKGTGYIPVAGDYIVHDIHGIGRFIGVAKLKTGETVRDYGRVIYRNDEVLFVPVENLDKLSKYTGGGEPKLSKMGGAEFAKVKESVKKSVRQLAFNLLELYNKRERAAGHVYGADTEWQREFEDGFEFDETDDQLTAVADIKSDLENGRIMDRLLCGDAGYGKTEVALRAIFKVVTEGKQAAILTPTTILARQHYNTVLSRTKNFKLNVGILSRFESREEVKKVLKDLKDGRLNIIVATHRLLSDDVSFHDIGLLVLDEEQRFGVEHKEKIKTVKNNVNVLTLSATPIPRTLHMSLSGIRDISLLETPPKNRVPVETYVTEYSEGLIKDAVLREKSRGGQCFILFNNVERIDGFAYGISRLFDASDDIQIIVAHGKMTGAVLDEKMTAFYNGEADLLVCTTIIENGIDLPNANTIIVCNADKFGLATLYQLRGRVGRSGLVAHAYFTYEPGKILTESAMQRLNAVMDYTDFGSGYKLAMRDLEIRGAGSVLGAEQHGHMERVGYELYSRMLKEAVSELRGEAVEKSVETEVRFDVDIDTYIDDSYASGADKLEIYNKIARIENAAGKTKYLAELNEIYGKPPVSVLNLIDIALIKNMAGRLDALRIMINARGLGITFDKTFSRHKRLVNLIAKDKNSVLTGSEKAPALIFNARNLNTAQKIERLSGFLRAALGEK
ncbi:MAG: transcription-repair coupling factor [Clostridiales bacterium]|jgi:transcription-repair coupling factor (superfamily II helicase)|nr:transcription-repair coupling factor [Clostridiales bacterium]